MGFRSLSRRIEKSLIDNSPAILSGLACAGVAATAYLTAQATVKAVRIIDGETDKRERDGLAFPTIGEKVEMVWKLYIPPGLTIASTMVCVILSNRASDRRTAALAAAYKLSEEAYERYRSQVIERIGAKKEDIIRAEATKARAAKVPGPSEVIIAGSGEVLCFDAYTGRFFKSDIETIRAVQNNLNCAISSGGSYASLSDFYEQIGLAATSCSDEVGWNLDRMVDIRFSPILVEGKPCVGLDFDVIPFRNYRKLI
jgi:hypothetical protein